MIIFKYEVLVVGFGVGGVMVVYEFIKVGINVLLFEVGCNYDLVKEMLMFKCKVDVFLMVVGNVDKDFGYYDVIVDGGWMVFDEFYIIDEDLEFLWW